MTGRVCLILCEKVGDWAEARLDFLLFDSFLTLSGKYNPFLDTVMSFLHIVTM